MPIISTRRLAIDYLTEDDAPFIVELLNTPTWIEFIGDKGVRGLPEARKYLTDGPIASYSRNGFGLYKVSLSDGTPIGLCGIIKRAGLDCPDIGFAILPGYAGKGYMYEAASAIITYAQKELHIRRLAGITTRNNGSSMRLLQKLGLKYQTEVTLPGNAETFKLFLLDIQAPQ